MRLLEQEQKIGVELEFYRKDLSPEIADKLVDNARKSRINVCGDASLGNGGVELKFNGGIPIKESMPVIKAMQHLAKGSVMKTDAGNDMIPEAVRKMYKMEHAPSDYKFGQVDEIEGGTTGLHIHFEVPEQATFLDHVALAVYSIKHDETFRNLAWRNSKVWAKHSSEHLDYLHDTTSHSDSYASLCDSKYMGVNMKNSGRGLNTIEFRYGDSALIGNLSAFKKYMKFCKKAMDKCMIGRKEFSYTHNGIKIVLKQNDMKTLEVQKTMPDGGIQYIKANLLFNSRPIICH